jgi:glycosyltransferase involved in cell wall biosynthesis
MTSGIKVLQVLPQFGAGGAEHMAMHLMLGLCRTHAVSAAGLFPSSNSAAEGILSRAGIPLFHLGKRPGFDPRTFAAFDRLLAEVQPDIVHTHLSVLRYALPGLYKRRVRTIHTLHNLAQYETDAFGRLLNRWAFRGTVLPVAISAEVAASVRRFYGVECAAMVPNCIPVEEFSYLPQDRQQFRTRQGFDDKAILLISVARLEPQKNPLLLLRAFERLCCPAAHLLMFGSGSMSAQVSAYVRSHLLQDRVHLMGKRSDIPQWLAASDIFVLSSDWEGNPLAVMEAMAAGLPVVATAVGGVPELVESGKQGYLVPAGDLNGLTEALRRLLDHPGRRIVLGHSARVRASECFNLDRMTQGYANLYRECLNQGRPVSSAAVA